MNRKYPARRKKRKVPAATVALYIGMVVIILGLVAVVFIVTYNTLGGGNDSKSADGASSSSGFILPNDESVSSVQSENSVPESSSETEFSSSSQSSSSSSKQSSSSKTQSSSKAESHSSTPQSSSSSDGDGQTLPTNYNKEFFEDDLFIGDSIFTGLYLYSYIDKANVAAKVGYTPNGALTTAFDEKNLSAVDYAKQRQPKRIFILIGSNAIGNGLDSLKNSYSNLLSTLISELPDTTICCISLTPTARVTDYTNIKNSDIVAMNDYLKQQCKALGLGFYDLYSSVSDSQGYFLTEYAEVDGMHFKPITYKVLLSALQKKYS